MVDIHFVVGNNVLENVSFLQHTIEIWKCDRPYINFYLWHVVSSIHNEYCQVLLHTRDQTKEEIAQKVLSGNINLQY
jgi:hypothetical protein